MKFEVYICTAAERNYAMEVWRLLDPGYQMIPFTELGRRVVNVDVQVPPRGDRGESQQAGTANPPVQKKTLSQALQFALGGRPGYPMPFAVIVDDRADVSPIIFYFYFSATK